MENIDDVWAAVKGMEGFLFAVQGDFQFCDRQIELFHIDADETREKSPFREFFDAEADCRL